MKGKNEEYFKKKLGALPRFPRKSPPYRIHWNWDITFQCNYRCSYCEVEKNQAQFDFREFDLGRWREIWDRIFDDYWCTHVRFAGGEPTIYPKFLELLGMLLEKHTVDITTNLGFDFRKFLKSVPPGRGLSVSASLHPEYAELEPFLEKVEYLHKNGYPATICYVGYPPHLEKILEYKKRVEGRRIYFKIIPFSGEYKGNPYPQSYTAGERRLLEGLAKDSADEHLNEMNTRWYEHLVVKEDEPEKKIKKGMLCRMGEMYAKIHPDGTVTRCCAGYHGQDSGVLGSILDKNFRLLDEAAPCSVSYQCPCFKAMAVGNEEEQWLPLWEALEHPVYRTELIREYVESLSKKSKKAARNE
ncbi:MAG TPA: radical SAM protein [bacterium]|nr:radical SAM protein [bacterium]